MGFADDVWTTAEKLRLAQCVQRSGEGKWSAVSRMMASYAPKAPHFYSPENCESQYTTLLAQADEPPQKRRARVARSPPAVRVARSLRQSRIAELKSAIEEDERTLQNLVTELSDIKQGRWDDRFPGSSPAGSSPPAMLQTVSEVEMSDDMAIECTGSPKKVKGTPMDAVGMEHRKVTTEELSKAIGKRPPREVHVESAAVGRKGSKSGLQNRSEELARRLRQTSEQQLLNTQTDAAQVVTPVHDNTGNIRAVVEDERASASKPAVARFGQPDMPAESDVLRKGTDNAGIEAHAQSRKAEDQKDVVEIQDPAWHGEYMTRARRRSLSLSIDTVLKAQAESSQPEDAGKQSSPTKKKQRSTMKEECKDSDLESSLSSDYDASDFGGSRPHNSASSSSKTPSPPANVGGAAGLGTSDVDRERGKKWKKLILPIWSRVADHRHGPMFMHSVKEKEVPGYYKAVKRPMTLADVKKRVTSGAITSTAEFHRDVLQVFANALMFNKDNSDIYRMAAELYEDARRTILQHVQTERAVHRRDSGGPARRKSVSVGPESSFRSVEVLSKPVEAATTPPQLPQPTSAHS